LSQGEGSFDDPSAPPELKEGKVANGAKFFGTVRR
jgi:hypothetical protein